MITFPLSSSGMKLIRMTLESKFTLHLATKADIHGLQALIEPAVRCLQANRQ
jgi:hypothetical protein